MSSSAIINILQEQGKASAVKYNDKLTVLDLANAIVVNGEQANLSAELIDAALVAIALTRRRYNLGQKISVSALQSAAGADALRTAVLYSSLRDPNTELWQGPMTIAVSQASLEKLKTINVLQAYSAQAVMSYHLDYAAQLGFKAGSSQDSLNDLNSKRMARIQAVKLEVEGKAIALANSHIISQLACSLAIDPPAPVFTKDMSGNDITIFTSKSSLSAAFSKVKDELLKIDRQYVGQLDLIQAGQYQKSFTFQ